MDTPDTLKRTPITHRPWLTSKLYDEYTKPSILHCDAYVMDYAAFTYASQYLVIDWREGGKKQVALDAYLIEPDGLTPVWDAARILATGARVYWTLANNAQMRGVHARVLAQGPAMLTLGRGRWARVVTQAHYVRARDADCEIKANGYVERTPGLDRPEPSATLDPGMIGRKRGRPRKIPIQGQLPDWL